jgi:hypothetical protein
MRLRLRSRLGYAWDGQCRLGERWKCGGHLVVVGPCVFWEVGEGFSGCEEQDVGVWVVGEEVEALRSCYRMFVVGIAGSKTYGNA